MRHASFLTPALVLGLFAAASAAALAAPTSLDLSAQRVNFYYNRFIVTGDGDVRVRFSDGTVVTGQTFTMDLKLNRYLIAGDVHVDGPGIHQAGAGLAGYPDLDRTFFLPAGDNPERFTYFGADWSNAHPGREQPGDAYNFPDLSGERPYIMAHGARIVPKTNVLFDQARVYTAGIYLYSPRYVVTFAATPHFFENAFEGARADVAVPFNGSAHSLSALHIRNDAFNGTYLAIDQHFVWDQDYIVAAIDPLTQEQRQYNLIGYKRFSPKLEGRLFSQESAAQAGIINRPSNAAAFTELQFNAGLRRSGISFTQDYYWQQLLGLPQVANDNQAYGNFDPRWREHPMSAQITWTGYENRITKAMPLLFRLRSSTGFAHDVYGEGGYPNEQPGPPTSRFTYAGGTLYTPAIRLGRGVSFEAVYDRQRTWFNLPHQIDQAATRVALSKQWARNRVSTFVAYEVRNTADYWGAQQLAAYPAGTLDCPDPLHGSDVCVTQFGSFGGQNAFRGLATSRSATASAVFAPTQYVTLNLSYAHFREFPAAVPGLYGQPPNQFIGDLRVRLSRQVQVDLSRQYYFNFANERWTPSFGIQFTP